MTTYINCIFNFKINVQHLKKILFMYISLFFYDVLSPLYSIQHYQVLNVGVWNNILFLIFYCVFPSIKSSAVECVFTVLNVCVWKNTIFQLFHYVVSFLESSVLYSALQNPEYMYLKNWKYSVILFWYPHLESLELDSTLPYLCLKKYYFSVIKDAFWSQKPL